MPAIRTVLLPCLLLVTPALHAAEANKCMDARGNVTLTDAPCNALPAKRTAPPAGQARASETLAQPKPEPILPPPDQPLPSPPAPQPASPATPRPSAPIAPQTQPMQR
ncbi:MAG: hypothetical protein KGL40_06305 [Rhodocyclaceae bacterium]|nr:hypothetical protein [Rhodocyclaceae bacterium]